VSPAITSAVAERPEGCSSTPAVLRPDADEVLRDDSLTKQLVKGCLQVGLLTKGIGTRGRQHFLRAKRCKVASEALKCVTVRTLFGWRLGC
jgi:hypothetical protein